MKRTRTDPTELRSFLYELSMYPGRSQSGWGTFSGVKYYSLPLSNIGTGLSNRPNINRLRLYAVATDLLEDKVSDILKISEKRWEIEECFRIMKTDFEARPVFLQKEKSIQAHFLTCFLALMLYRYLEKELKNEYTCEAILTTLKEINFADVQEQGFIPLYRRSKLTDALHEACGFRTDFEFISKQQMKTIQKKSKGRE